MTADNAVEADARWAAAVRRGEAYATDVPAWAQEPELATSVVTLPFGRLRAPWAWKSEVHRDGHHVEYGPKGPP